MIVAGAGGLLLNQLTFQAGPLAASLPAISTVDPLFSIALGVIIYDEQIRHGLTAGVGLGALLLVLGSRSSNCPAPGLPPPSTPPHHDRPVPSPLMIGPSLTVPGSDGADGSSGAPERRYLQWLFILGHRGRSDSPLPPESSAPSDAPSLPAPPAPAGPKSPSDVHRFLAAH